MIYLIRARPIGCTHNDIESILIQLFYPTRTAFPDTHARVRSRDEIIIMNILKKK